MDYLWEMDLIFLKTGSHVYQGRLELAMFSSCVLITFSLLRQDTYNSDLRKGELILLIV